jgi:3-oxoacyl-[acyl-carrier protein] reductase
MIGEETMRLANKYALITGAGRGIGLATARAFVREGATVAVADIDPERAESALQTLERLGGRGLAVHVDVADPASIDEMLRTILDAFGRIDILSNNAGVGATRPSWRRRLPSGS